MSAGLVGIDISSGVAFDGKGFCRVDATLDDGTVHTGDLPPAMVQQMALGWLQAAEAAEHDAAVYAELTETLGLTHNVAGHFINRLRDRRTPTPTEPGANT